MIFQTDFTEMNFLHLLLPRDIDNCDVTMETKGISNVFVSVSIQIQCIFVWIFFTTCLNLVTHCLLFVSMDTLYRATVDIYVGH